MVHIYSTIGILQFMCLHSAYIYALTISYKNIIIKVCFFFFVNIYSIISSRSQHCCLLSFTLPSTNYYASCHQQIVMVILIPISTVIGQCVLYISTKTVIFLVTTAQCTQVDKAIGTNLAQENGHILFVHFFFSFLFFPPPFLSRCILL